MDYHQNDPWRVQRQAMYEPPKPSHWKRHDRFLMVSYVVAALVITGLILAVFFALS